MNALASYIEHTNLKPTVTQQDIELLTQEAIENKFFGVCVPPYWIKKVRRDLGDNDVQLVTVAGFPLGFSRSETKRTEIEKAISEGVNEVDIVFNLTAFKSGSHHWAKVEIAQFAKLVHEAEVMLKVIIETAYLTQEEMKTAALICLDAGADFVKTSTGFAPEGAQVEDVKLLRSILPDSVGIKASGGIKSKEQAIAFIEAGAERIGTSSGIEIIKG